MTKLLSLLTVLLLVIFVFACSEEDNQVNPNNPTLTGSWKGKATFMGIGVGFLDGNLSQSGTSVSGGTMIYGVMVANDTLDCTVSGNNNYPNVSFTSTAPAPGGMYSLTFTGTFVNKDSLTGTFKDDGSGVSYSMGIKRQ